MKSTIKIGRDSSNDVIINEPRVSRNHAIITDLGDGTFEIKDLGSTNGTFVNGERVNQKVIRPGDKVEVSNCIANWYDAFTNSSGSNSSAITQERPFSKIKKTISVGSATNNDLVISSSFVTSQHARISVLKDHTYFIEDLGSSNGTYVNSVIVKAKNFTKTDLVRIASEDLPADWYKHKNLKTNLLKDNKTVLLISFIMVIIIAGSILSYINCCNWLGCRCSLTSEQIYLSNRNCVVYIEHTYFYTIKTNGVTFFIGKNKEFKGTEANTSKENLLPYGKATGSGCFITKEGAILTSQMVLNPWFNTLEINKMLGEVVESKTIKDFSLNQEYTIGGETSELKWIVNGAVNNVQNFTAAVIKKRNTINEGNCAIIQSVRQTIPVNSTIPSLYFDKDTNDFFHSTSSYYYSYLFPLRDNDVVRDTFFSAMYNSNINKVKSIPLNKSLPKLPEGSIVLNQRGELVGIVQQQNVVFLHRFYKQLTK